MTATDTALTLTNGPMKRESVMASGFFTQIKGTVIAGLVILALFFGGLGTWSALAPLASAVVASGVVKVAGNRKTVQHLEGGIISELLVKNGGRVKAGDLLVRLDDAQARASWELVRGQYLARRALEARLVAEREGTFEIAFPDELSALSGDHRVAEIIAGQNAQFAARQRRHLGEVDILTQRIDQLKSEIGSYNAQKRAASEQLVILEEEAKPLRKLVEQQLVPKKTLQDVQRQAAQMRGVRDQQQGQIARAEQLIGETELQIIDIRNKRSDEILDELRQVQTEIIELKEKLAATRDILKRGLIVAPIDGVVVDLQYFTAGGVIKPGDPIMDIVPASDDLVIEVAIKPADIDNVIEGLDAEVRFTAFKQRSTPTLEGKVIYVSADTLVSEDEEAATYFLAQVEIGKQELSQLGDLEISPGMPAQVMIKGGERTLLGYLFDPLRDSLNTALREQ